MREHWHGVAASGIHRDEFDDPLRGMPEFSTLLLFPASGRPRGSRVLPLAESCELLCHPQSNFFRNLTALSVSTVAPYTAKQTICGHSTDTPTPFKKIPLTISIK